MPPRTALSENERSLLSRLRQLLNGNGFLRGSLVKMKRRCGKPYCHCAQDDSTKHVSLYISQSREGKQRMVSVPKNRQAQVREWVERYQEAREILEELSDLSWDRIRFPKD